MMREKAGKAEENENGEQKGEFHNRSRARFRVRAFSTILNSWVGLLFGEKTSVSV
jgi:hypothetical protein